MKDNIKKVIEEFQKMPEVIRFKELEHYIDTNSEVQECLSQINEKKKQMINAKEFQQPKQFKIYEEEYHKLNEELQELPFVEEYLELIEMIHQKLIDFKLDIEKELEKDINAN